MNAWLWIAFALLIGTLVVYDLVVLSRRTTVRGVGPAEARTTVALWVLGTIAFSAMLAKVYGHNWLELQSIVLDPTLQAEHARAPLAGHSAWLQFIACYVLEIALSIDNIAVLALLFAYYQVPPRTLARVLFWNLIIALSARFGLIVAAGGLLLSIPWFHWLLGGLIILSMCRVLLLPDEHTEFDRRWYVRLLKFRTASPHNAASPTVSFLSLVLISSFLDLSSIADSVPALFSVTRDSFIAFTASAMGMLGMRALYFALAGSVARFRYLKVSLLAVLLFVSAKMLLAQYDVEYRNVPIAVTLAVVVGVMLLGIGASMLRNRSLASTQPLPTPTSPPPRPAVIEDLSEAMLATRRNLRKVFILIVGTAVIIFGIIITPLPGPGPMVLVPIGLAILATEFIWARILLNKLKDGALNISDRVDAFADRTPLIIFPILLVGWCLLAWGVTVWLTRSFEFRWYLVAIAFAFPLIPALAWAFNYLRKRFRSNHRKP